MKRFSIHKIYEWLASHWPYLALVCIEIVLFTSNYKSGTHLIGWDNLFPEFNFPVNFTRSINAVWQEYRGMGVIDNMSHAATIIEDIERFILALVFPTALVRWVYLILLHLVGGLGVVTMLKSIFHTRKHDGLEQIANSIAIVAALFYQYNLGTIQQFYLPMEVFAVHFAFLPWLLWSSSKLFERCSRHNIIRFGIISLLATPQAHVPTLFIVYGMATGIIILSKIATQRSKAIKPALVLIATIGITNAFWLFPFGYATITHSREVATSKAFEMASNDIFYRNHKYGDLNNVALIKGSLLEYFYFDYQNNDNHTMFRPWLRHMETPPFQIIAMLFFALAVVGFGVALFRRDVRFTPYALLFGFSIFMLGTNIPVLKSLNFFIRDTIPLFATVFRFVFTKFSILYTLSFAIMLGYGIFTIAQMLKRRKELAWVMVISTLLLVFWYATPAFQKAFFYRNLKVELPQKYVRAFDFFKNQDPADRVALLPIPWYWAWVQPDWGTINSGFLWYAIPQASTDLAFTPWGKNNENFYWELNQALIEQKISNIEKIFEKYDITWVYFDKSILNAQSRKLTHASVETLLLESGKIKKQVSFDDISIYKYEPDVEEKKFISVISNPPKIAYSSSSNDQDALYAAVGNYIQENEAKNAHAIIPFQSLFSGKKPAVREFDTSEDDKNILLESPVTIDTDTLRNYSLLRLENLNGDERFNASAEGVKLPIQSAFIVKSLSENKSQFAYQIDKASSRIYNSDDDIWYTDQAHDFCPNTPENAKIEKLITNKHTTFRLTSKNTNNCIRVALPSVLHRFGYVVRIEYEADLQRGWFLNIYNTSTNKSILETYLEKNGKRNVEYLVLSPGEEYGMGYTMYFNNKSEGVETVTNSLINVSVYQVPYNEMKSRMLLNTRLPYVRANMQKNTTVSEVSHPNAAFYKITLTSNANINDYLYLSQSFDPGWVAYETDNTWFPFFGRRLTDHVLVNNWANAWRIEDPPKSADQTIQEPSTNNSEKAKDELRRRWNNRTFVIVFWPQYLQYLGFGILGATILYLIALTLPKPLSHKTKIRPPSNNT